MRIEVKELIQLIEVEGFEILDLYEDENGFWYFSVECSLDKQGFIFNLLDYIKDNKMRVSMLNLIDFENGNVESSEWSIIVR